MKKPLIYTFTAALLLSSTTFAFDEQMQDGLADATQTLGQVRSVEKLDEAIEQRQYYYLKNKIRNNSYKNRKNQWYRHIMSRANASTDEVSTFTRRSGELEDVPYYKQRRATTDTAISAPNNAKRNFRTRAYDYYVEGGNAGTDVLESDVVLSSEHKSPSRYWSQAINSQGAADLISGIRAMQRNRRVNDQVPTGYQSTTFRRGDSSRNFLHPYMNFNIEQ